MKKCSKCLLEKEYEEFYKRSDRETSNGLSSHCKKCIQKYKGCHYENNKYTHKARWQFTKSAANRKGALLTITQAQYVELISKPCHYCNESIEKEVGIGLDRQDNSRGYHIDNVVTCCGRCNLGRQDLFTPEEWKVMIDALKQYKTSVVSASCL